MDNGRLFQWIWAAFLNQRLYKIFYDRLWHSVRPLSVLQTVLTIQRVDLVNANFDKLQDYFFLIGTLEIVQMHQNWEKKLLKNKCTTNCVPDPRQSSSESIMWFLAWSKQSMPPDHSEVSGGGGGRGEGGNKTKIHVSSPSKTCHVYTMASAFSTFLRL